MSPSSVVAVQETHGSEELARDLVHFVHKPCACHASFKMILNPLVEGGEEAWIPDPCAAGVITSIPEPSNPQITSERFPEVLVPGRALCVMM
eukprot:8417856-Pyramimonas_sp.AAC.1